MFHLGEAAREGFDHLILGANGERSVRIVVLDIPPSGNVLRRKYRNRFAYAKLRDTWKRDLWYSVSGKERDWLLGMANAGQKMRVTISVAHKKLYDTDNLYSGVKPLLDALRAVGLLHDDSPEFCELLCSQEKINDKRTTITIEDLHS
jgi:Holliday junction resolvase RusA-like endonuclease